MHEVAEHNVSVLANRVVGNPVAVRRLCVPAKLALTLAPATHFALKNEHSSRVGIVRGLCPCFHATQPRGIFRTALVAIGVPRRMARVRDWVFLREWGSRECVGDVGHTPRVGHETADSQPTRLSPFGAPLRSAGLIRSVVFVALPRPASALAVALAFVDVCGCPYAKPVSKHLPVCGAPRSTLHRAKSGKASATHSARCWFLVVRSTNS